MSDLPLSLKPCAECDRQVSSSVTFCCAGCSLAADGYEIHEDGPLAHSAACNARHTERGPVPRPGAVDIGPITPAPRAAPALSPRCQCITGEHDATHVCVNVPAAQDVCTPCLFGCFP